MNQEEIEGFLAVVEHGSISRAAERLFLTQPTLSNRIDALERKLGAQVFRRSKGKREVQLTEAGRRFVPIAEKWRLLWQESRAIGQEEGRGVLRIAAISSVNFCFMPRIYRSFLQESAGGQIALGSFQSYEIFHRVERGEAHIGFVGSPMYAAHVEAIPLFREEMALVCSKKAPLPPAVNPAELDVRQEILVEWGPEFAQWDAYWFGASTRPRAFLDDILIFEQLLELPGSWAIVPHSLARVLEEKGSALLRQLADGPRARMVYLVQRRDHPQHAQVQLLLREMRQEVEGSPGACWLYREE